MNEPPTMTILPSGCSAMPSCRRRRTRLGGRLAADVEGRVEAARHAGRAIVVEDRQHGRGLRARGAAHRRARDSVRFTVLSSSSTRSGTIGTATMRGTASPSLKNTVAFTGRVVGAADGRAVARGEGGRDGAGAAAGSGDRDRRRRAGELFDRVARGIELQNPRCRAGPRARHATRGRNEHRNPRRRQRSVSSAPAR